MKRTSMLEKIAKLAKEQNLPAFEIKMSHGAPYNGYYIYKIENGDYELMGHKWTRVYVNSEVLSTYKKLLAQSNG